MTRHSTATVGPGQWVKVYCNGDELDRVIEADDELGFAIVYATGWDGKVMTSSSGKLKKKLVTGDIRVVITNSKPKSTPTDLEEATLRPDSFSNVTAQMLITKFGNRASTVAGEVLGRVMQLEREEKT